MRKNLLRAMCIALLGAVLLTACSKENKLEQPRQSRLACQSLYFLIQFEEVISRFRTEYTSTTNENR